MMQMALELTPPRLNRDVAMQVATRQADAAIARCKAKVSPLFIEQASVHMLAYLQVHGKSSGELLTDSCKLASITSTDDRHFGPVFRSLIRRGLIRWAGSCRRVKGHASRGGSLYELVLGGADAKPNLA